MRGGEFEYIPRKPEETVLYQVIAEQLETFLSLRAERERPLPGFVEHEFRKYLTCGIAEHGFIRLHCGACGLDRLVPFSCKKRGICNSCGARRMADTAAHLVDRVFPLFRPRNRGIYSDLRTMPGEIDFGLAVHGLKIVCSA